MSNFIPVDRQTDYLFPPSVQDWLPENHLARFIVEVIERLDLSELTRQYGGRGSAAHHPARSEEHTSELQSLMRISYAVFCLKKKKIPIYKQYRRDHYQI